MLDEFIHTYNFNKFSVLVAVVMMEYSSYNASTLKMIAKMAVVFFQMSNHSVTSFNGNRTLTSLLQQTADPLWLMDIKRQKKAHYV